MAQQINGNSIAACTYEDHGTIFKDVRTNWTTKDLEKVGRSAWHFRREVVSPPI